MMINIRLGLEQGGEVFAVPGVAQSMRSKSTHRLLRQPGPVTAGQSGRNNSFENCGQGAETY